MSKHTTFTVNSLSCDWITLTSFDQRNKRRWETVLNGSYKVVSYDVKSAMYVGVLYNHGFVGQSEQKGLTHTLCRATGGAANEVFYRLMRASAGDYKATRVDIQLTIPLPHFHKARELKDYLERNQRLSCRLIENSGLDTVYVGSRQSSRMWRIYVKEGEGLDLFLRFELELKKGKDNIADRVAANIKRHGYKAMQSYFFENLDKLNLPDAYMRILNEFRTGETQPLPSEVREKGGKTYAWLNTTVRKAILTFALESHGRSEFMHKWLKDIADEIDKRANRLDKV